MKNKTNEKLPQKIVVLPNEDKKFHESVDETNLCNFPHPFRMILCGPILVKQILFIIYF